MNQNIDSKIRTKLLENDIQLPDKCRKRMNETMQGLPDKVNKKGYIRFRPMISVAVICLFISSITAIAAVDYVRQRMEDLSEDEKDSYYEEVQNSPANADSYSREFTDGEKEKMEELKARYEKGVFPAQKLFVVKTQSDAYGSKDIYFVEDTSLFVLPTRELTEEEILEIIDFYYCRDYSLTKEAKENIVTVSPDEFVKKGGMDEHKATELAKADLEKVYGIDCEEFEISAAYHDFDGSGNVYIVTMTDNKTKSDYSVSINPDQELVTNILYTKQGSNIAGKIEVDQEKFTAKYGEALDILKQWKGEDLPISQASCEYNYNSDDYLEHGMVSYLFELEDGTGYVLYYSCENDVFFQIFMTDYEKYRQRVDQNEDKRQKRGINRKMLQMQ